MESHSAKPAYEYQPTIIETRFLIERLAIQIALLRDELKRNWIECKRNPCKFLTCLIRQLLAHLKRFFIAPYVLRASSTAITAVTCLVVVVLLVERTASKPGSEPENADRAPEVVMLNVERVIPKDDSGFGKNGNGRVGLQSNKGEGSGAVRQSAQGGGGGGDRSCRRRLERCRRRLKFKRRYLSLLRSTHRHCLSQASTSIQHSGKT
jgi:hypothetical protein